MAALAARPPLSLGQHPTRNADSLSDCLTAAAGLDEGLRHYFKNRVPAGEQLPYAVVGGVAVAALLGVGVSKAHHEQIYHPSHMPTRSEELEVMLHSVGRFTKDLDFDCFLGERPAIRQLHDSIGSIPCLPSTQPTQRVSRAPHAPSIRPNLVSTRGKFAVAGSKLIWHHLSGTGYHVECDVKLKSHVFEIMEGFRYGANIYKASQRLVRRVAVADEQRHLVGHVQTWEPWVIIILKLLAWHGRKSGDLKDLFDVRLLLEAHKLDTHNGAVGHLHLQLGPDQWSTYFGRLKPEAIAELHKIKTTVTSRKTLIPPLVQQLATEEFNKVVAHVADRRPINTDQMMRELKGRWAACFRDLDAILAHLPAPCIAHSLAKSPYEPAPRGLERAVVHRERWYL